MVCLEMGKMKPVRGPYRHPHPSWTGETIVVGIIVSVRLKHTDTKKVASNLNIMSELKSQKEKNNKRLQRCLWKMFIIFVIFLPFIHQFSQPYNFINIILQKFRKLNVPLRLVIPFFILLSTIITLFFYDVLGTFL